MPIAIIPSRFGSSRFEGKPLALIAGKTMIQRVYEQTQKSKAITRTIVATDDELIFNAVKAFKGEVIMTSTQCRTGTDRVSQTADILNISPDEIVVNIQGDQPIFKPVVIQELISVFEDDPKLYMSTLAINTIKLKEIKNPKDIKVIFDKNNFAIYFSRAQIPFPRDKGAKAFYYKHLGFYAYKKSFLDKFANLPTQNCEHVEKLEQLRVLESGFKIKVVVTQHDSLEIDIPEDIKRIEALFELNSDLPNKTKFI